MLRQRHVTHKNTKQNWSWNWGDEPHFHALVWTRRGNNNFPGACQPRRERRQVRFVHFATCRAGSCLTIRASCNQHSSWWFSLCLAGVYPRWLYVSVYINTETQSPKVAGNLAESGPTFSLRARLMMSFSLEAWFYFRWAALAHVPRFFHQSWTTRHIMKYDVSTFARALGTHYCGMKVHIK